MPRGRRRTPKETPMTLDQLIAYTQDQIDKHQHMLRILENAKHQNLLFAQQRQKEQDRAAVKELIASTDKTPRKRKAKRARVNGRTDAIRMMIQRAGANGITQEALLKKVTSPDERRRILVALSRGVQKGFWKQTSTGGYTL